MVYVPVFCATHNGTYGNPVCPAAKYVASHVS